MVPGEDPDRGDFDEAFPAWQAPGRMSSCSRKPQITASAKILQLTVGHDPEPEAAD